MVEIRRAYGPEADERERDRGDRDDRAGGVPRGVPAAQAPSDAPRSRAAAYVVRAPAIRIAFISAIERTPTIATIRSCPGLPNTAA